MVSFFSVNVLSSDINITMISEMAIKEELHLVD